MLHRDKPRTYRTGWCEAENHHRCPHLVRAHRFTPTGRELRRIVCACRCHHGVEPPEGQ